MASAGSWPHRLGGLKIDTNGISLEAYTEKYESSEEQLIFVKCMEVSAGMGFLFSRFFGVELLGMCPQYIPNPRSSRILLPCVTALPKALKPTP